MENKNIVLNLKDVRKTYPNGFEAIFNLNLEIEKGEFVVFVGPSGCGKTTTIRMIAGLEKLSSGSLELNGRNITDLPARKRNVSMVFQNYALFPHLSVKENMTFTLKTRKTPKDIIEKKIKWVSEILGLKYVLNRKPAQLSGGQRQRVALGRAMVAEPTLFLMDEPLSNLDARLRGVMRTTIRKLHEQLNTTSIYVTHDQVEAMTMADKIVVMSNGFIQQVGTPEEVFTTPANLFVANFIGSPSINIIEGTLDKNNINFEILDKKYKLDISARKIMRKSTTKNVKMGIRPQHIKAVSKKTKYSFPYEVDFVEILGAETIVFCKGGLKYVCPVEERPKKGETVYLEFSPKKIHLFDGDTEISLTSPINSQTMKSIDTFLQSKDLIDKRTAIMEKTKNKKVNETLYQRASKSMFSFIWPQELLLNPQYSNLKTDQRNMVKSLKDAKRRKSTDEVSNHKDEIKLIKQKLSVISKEVRGSLPEIKKFKSHSHKLRKISESLLDKKTGSFNNLSKEVKKLNSQAKEINSSFDKNLYYDIPSIKEFNIKSKEVLSSKRVK